MNMLYNQTKNVLTYPASQPLSNNPSHRAAIKDLLLQDIYKKERIRCKLEHHHKNKNKERRVNRRTESDTHQEPPPKRAMVTPLVMGKVQYGLLKKASHFHLIKEELSSRNIPFSTDTNWMACLALLKKDEKDQKFFYPKTRSHKDYEDNDYLDI